MIYFNMKTRKETNQMEAKQIIMMVVMLLTTGGMAYLIGDLHGFIRGMRKATKIIDGDV